MVDDEHDAAGEPMRAAGDFGAWLDAMQRAIGGTGESAVPCAGCTACCTSSQFVHIEPDETDTLASIPAELLFPAPQSPRGHVLLGYDERGHCPMLVDDVCSIYEQRPRACRTYDCRILAAAGVEVDGAQGSIGARVRQWEFTYPSASDRARHDAVRAATTFLREHREVLGDTVPSNATGLAVVATEIHELFLAPRDPPDTAAVVEALHRRQGAARP